MRSSYTERRAIWRPENIPALHGMTLHGNLPRRVVAVAKSGWTLNQLAPRVEASSAAGPRARNLRQVCASLSYINGDYGDPATFNQLSQVLGDSVCPVHYLAIPARLYRACHQPLSRSGTSRRGRVIVKKAFGRELATARDLNRVIREHLRSEKTHFSQIDHYLGKRRSTESPLLLHRRHTE